MEGQKLLFGWAFYVTDSLDQFSMTEIRTLEDATRWEVPKLQEVTGEKLIDIWF